MSEPNPKPLSPSYAQASTSDPHRPRILSLPGVPSTGCNRAQGVLQKYRTLTKDTL